MIKWFKKHFIPHEGNDHQPHFLRTKNIRAVVLILFVLELGVFAIPYIPAIGPAYNNYLAAVLPGVLDSLSNQTRQENHLATLTVSPLLNKVAELKAKDMAEKGYFAHTSPEGRAPWYWFDKAGYKYLFAGENLAVDFTDSKDVTLAWMNSPTHRANIVKGVYTEMGTGVVSGNFEGHPTIFVVQVYARPLTTIATVSEPSAVSNIKPTTTQTTKTVESKVLGAEVALDANVTSPTQPKSNLLMQYVTSPGRVANMIFVILGIMILLALVLKLFIRTDKRHPKLITNGLVVLVLIFGIYSVNSYITKNKISHNITFYSFNNENLTDTY
ncbi:MAG: CAP domain-containing protein [Minisyncoccia bacterium]